MNNFINNALEWVKNNKLLTFVLLIVGYLIFATGTNISNLSNEYSESYRNSFGASDMGYTSNVPAGFNKIGILPPSYETAPQMSISDRKVVTNSYASLVVKDVRDSLEKIQIKAKEFDGYYTNTNVYAPTNKEYETGNIVIRVPLEKREGMLIFLRSISIKVVSEEISANDVTDQYIDTQSRLNTLRTTKTKYEEIFDRATAIQDILQVQQHILQVQDQIDAVQGQINYMDATSKSTLISVYLSTDELALSINPDRPLRPTVVFKLAVKSVLTTVQALVAWVIWITVYSVLWIPALIIIWIVKKRFFQRHLQ